MPKETFSSLQRLLFIGVLLGVTALTLWVLWPFVMSVFWAIVLAIVLRPVFVRILPHRPASSALITILLALIVIGAPLYLITARAAQEGVTLYQKVNANNTSFVEVIENPYVAKALDTVGVSPSTLTSELRSLTQKASGIVASGALSFGAATADFLLKLAIMLYLLFFFLKDGKTLGRYLQRIIPFGDDREELLFHRFTSTTLAIVKGTVIVALVQGAVGALLFLIAGVGSPVLWGVVMAFAAMIPAVGPFVIWLPAGLLLLALGHTTPALIILLGGAFVIGSIDNFLRPVLVGRDTQMPDALVLLGILGGLSTFGLAGLIMGPVIMALFISVWDLFGKDFGEEIAVRG